MHPVVFTRWGFFFQDCIGQARQFPFRCIIKETEGLLKTAAQMLISFARPPTLLLSCCFVVLKWKIQTRYSNELKLMLLMLFKANILSIPEYSQSHEC